MDTTSTEATSSVPQPESQDPALRPAPKDERGARRKSCAECVSQGTEGSSPAIHRPSALPPPRRCDLGQAGKPEAASPACRRFIDVEISCKHSITDRAFGTGRGAAPPSLQGAATQKSGRRTYDLGPLAGHHPELGAQRQQRKPTLLLRRTLKIVERNEKEAENLELQIFLSLMRGACWSEGQRSFCSNLTNEREKPLDERSVFEPGKLHAVVSTSELQKSQPRQDVVLQVASAAFSPTNARPVDSANLNPNLIDLETSTQSAASYLPDAWHLKQLEIKVARFEKESRNKVIPIERLEARLAH
ncbi:hypothetical protein A1Q1_07559 [Trichosporon asahii var. asahii CBS 2479]|uniref:Uncharacterized protein n=1 Tax=Trichosporon asahii var. asahii (strain ATCC 90039 / CBS 2479 / JCM 2466 / KCTC 7840 / NBRC 103889/ NCYC 2677 / UAMH 7654) TaxID=1186058 RepID=J6F7B3_TRIAS|nr:hypothetical protein A1Q1_07559 [Trichosporon asahii var. asahii CBS 2479]EJT51232.1 hypothetical protein A1Q1_07559 [Trichosporon asahii var. asahii CBS 2479]